VQPNKKPNILQCHHSLPGGFKDLKIGIHIENGELVNIDSLPPATPARQANNSASKIAIDQFTAYFSNPDMPLMIRGTVFQRKVWRALQAIPPGQTRSYFNVAVQLNSSARTVGDACRTNAIPIIIPCHRVVAKNGSGGLWRTNQR
jgi:methylated-DNA-[protein]-cysteine S-methyltransferase